MRQHDERPRTAGEHADDPDHGTRALTANGNVTDDDPYDVGEGPYDFDDPAADPETRAMADDRDRDFYEDLGRRPFRWNAGTDLGLLILRLAVGGLFAAHGAQKLFGVLGGTGTHAFAQTLKQLGYQHTDVLALVTGGTELGGGALLILGFATPLAAAGVLGVMMNAIATHYPQGFFLHGGAGVEFPCVLAAATLALLFTGAGRVAADKGRSWFRHPVASGTVGLVIAAAASAGTLLLLRG